MARDELTASFQREATEAQERVEILEQTVKMLMREIAARREDLWDRRLEAVLGQARRALAGEPMP